MFAFKYIKTVRENVATFDFIGYKPKLLYRGLEHAQTFIGGIISILAVIFCAAFGLYFFIQFFERQNSTITLNTESNPFPQYNMSKMPFIFKLVDGAIKDVPNDTSLYNWQGNFQNSAIATLYSFEACNISNPKHFGEYADYFRNISNISSYNCIDDLDKYNFNLYGLYEDTEHPNSFNNIVLNFCQNTTNSKTICKSQKEMNLALSSVYMKLIMFDYSIDHGNIHSPGKLVLQNHLIPFSLTIYKRYNMYEGLIKYQTDYGFVFPDIKTLDFFRLTNIEFSVDLRVQAGSVKFGHIAFFLSKDQKLYQRKYTKMQDVIASIGGFLNAILFAASCIVGFITKRIFLLNLANDSYVLKTKDKKKFMTMDTIKNRTRTDNDIMTIPEEGKRTMFGKYLDPEVENALGQPWGNLQMTNLNSIIIPTEFNKLPKTEVDTAKDENKNELPEISKSVLKPQIQQPIKHDFRKHSHDENGKLQMDWRNIFWPDKGVTKVYEVMKKKSGIDEVLSYCSQVEKIKKYLFTTKEELDIFDNIYIISKIKNIEIFFDILYIRYQKFFEFFDTIIFR